MFISNPVVEIFLNPLMDNDTKCADFKSNIGFRKFPAQILQIPAFCVKRN